MDTNALCDFCCYFLGSLALLGLLIYLPFKSHWGKIFGFMDSLLFCCGIVTPLMYLYLYMSSPEDWTVISMIGGLVVSAGFVIAGIGSLIRGWCNCNNIVEAIFLPVLMMMQFALYVAGFALIALWFIFATKQDSTDDYV